MGLQSWIGDSGRAAYDTTLLRWRALTGSVGSNPTCPVTNRRLRCSLYTEAQSKACANGHREWHFAAVLMRKNTPIRVGINNMTTSHRRAYKKLAEEGGYVNVYKLHAEMDALRAARPGDTLWVYRWTKAGIPKPSRPCEHCMAEIAKLGISRIYYHNSNGALVRERV